MQVLYNLIKAFNLKLGYFWVKKGIKTELLIGKKTKGKQL